MKKSCFKRYYKLCPSQKTKPINYLTLTFEGFLLSLVHKCNNQVIRCSVTGKLIGIPKDLPITTGIVNINCICTNISINFALSYQTGNKPLLFSTKTDISNWYVTSAKSILSSAVFAGKLRFFSEITVAFQCKVACNWKNSQAQSKFDRSD